MTEGDQQVLANPRTLLRDALPIEDDRFSEFGSQDRA
jgi:hypothetical protein